MRIGSFGRAPLPTSVAEQPGDEEKAFQEMLALARKPLVFDSNTDQPRDGKWTGGGDDSTDGWHGLTVC